MAAQRAAGERLPPTHRPTSARQPLDDGPHALRTLAFLQRAAGNRAAVRAVAASRPDRMVVQRVLGGRDQDRLAKYMEEKMPMPPSGELPGAQLEQQNELFGLLCRDCDSLDEARKLVNLLLTRHPHDLAAAVGDFQRQLQGLRFTNYTAGFQEAPAGKSVAYAGEATDYAGMKTRMESILAGEAPQTHHYRAEDYRQAVNGFRLDDHRGKRYLPDVFDPLVPLLPVMEANPDNRERITNLLSWLVPLHLKTVKGVNNSAGLMEVMKLLLRHEFDLLKVIEGGTAVPKRALLSMNPAREVAGYRVGVRSAVVTGKAGAIWSGEKSGARALETELSGLLDEKVDAGHLVANTLGGKNRDENLTPMTQTFNTSEMAAVEGDARRRLASGRIISYETTVEYQDGTGGLADVLPRKVEVKLATLDADPGVDSADIRSYRYERDAVAIPMKPEWPTL